MCSLPRGDITFLSAGLDGRLVVGSLDGCLRVFQVAESGKEERSVDGLFEKDVSVDRLLKGVTQEVSIGHLLRGDLDEECKETDTLLSSVTLSDVCSVIHDNP